MPRRYTPVEMIENLCGFDTTSRLSNLELIDFVANYLNDHGVRSELIRSPDGTKANLYATIGPAAERGVVLSGHTDVVPVDGQPWSSDPFKVVERDGRLFGRGTADMKSFIALALAALPDMQAARLKRPIHFAFSYDEEVGCTGVDGMIEHIRLRQPLPAMVIVGEPTEMAVVSAHKACAALSTVVTGLEGHSSNPELCSNAVVDAAQVIRRIDEVAQEFREKGPFNHAFTPAYTTINVSTVQGGTANNIIPNCCTIGWGIRAVPGVDIHAVIERIGGILERDVLPEMKARYPEAAIETKLHVIAPHLAEEPDSPAETLAKRLVGSNATMTVAYGTEGGKFQAIGIPTVVCGPGNIREAHKADEYIELSQVQAGARFITDLIVTMES